LAAVRNGLGAKARGLRTVRLFLREVAKCGECDILESKEKTMQTVRKIIDVKRLMPFIDIPDDMWQGQVEIIIMPVKPARAIKLNFYRRK
jgi:hypothetical protein